MTRRALQSRFRSLERRGPGLRLCLVSVLCLVTFLCGCTAQASSGSSSPTSGGPDGHSSSVAPAREGHPAASQRVTFIPERLTLRGHGSAEVQPAETVDGLLKVPENVQHVGWWDGSAQAGEPFGSTVIAGHVDSATEGIGFFARLRSIKVGEMVTLRAGSHWLKYRVTSVREVAETGAGDRQPGIQAERPASPGADHLHRATITATEADTTAILWWSPSRVAWLASASAGTACVRRSHPVPRIHRCFVPPVHRYAVAAEHGFGA